VATAAPNQQQVFTKLPRRLFQPAPPLVFLIVRKGKTG
jgi:hypothetical protein